MTETRLDWNDVNREEWEQTLAEIQYSNPLQDWDFGRAAAKAQGMSLDRALIRNGTKAVGLVQAFIKPHILGLRSIRILRGPLYAHTLPPDTVTGILTEIKTRYPLRKGLWLSIQPELPDSSEARHFLSNSGLLRLFAGYQTYWIDLTHSADDLRSQLHPKWRNQLNKAERANLEIHFGSDFDWLLDQYEQHRDMARFTGPSAAILADIPPEKTFTVTARHKGVTISGVLFLLHGQSATYQVAWTSDDGRSLHTTNRLLWEALLGLKEMGFTSLDLGGVDPINAPGIAHFKSRMGGASYTLVGTYI